MTAIVLTWADSGTIIQVKLLRKRSRFLMQDKGLDIFSLWSPFTSNKWRYHIGRYMDLGFKFKYRLEIQQFSAIKG